MAERGALRRIPRFAAFRSLWALNSVLDRVETAAAGSAESPLPQPPVFIVGPPRTGSTLLYQLVVGCFDVGYLSNRHCRLYGAPSLVERTRHPDPPSVLESRYGRTSGHDAPSECGEYWYRFFRRSPQYVPRGEADPEKLRRLRASVRALGKAAGRPLVFKNLICALRLGPISEALPEAVFVRIRRDVLATAVSLLAGRKALFGDYGHWWSSEPPGIDRLRTLPPHEQVVEQIAAVEELIDQARAEAGPERFCELTYETLCEDPAAALATIAALAERNGFRLTPRRPAPSSLEQAEPQPIDDDLQDQLAAHIRDR
jgi:LPS sulfotransferase NodH